MSSNIWLLALMYIFITETAHAMPVEKWENNSWTFPALFDYEIVKRLLKQDERMYEQRVTGTTSKQILFE